MVEIALRKYVTIVEEIFHEGGPVADRPLQAAAILAIVENPYAGRYEPDITPMMEALKPLGLDMSRRLIDALGGDPGRNTRKDAPPRPAARPGLAMLDLDGRSHPETTEGERQAG